MGNIFGASEIVEIAIQIERNGKDFYDAAVKSVKSPKTKEIFEYLSKEEEKHIKVFQGILGDLDKYEPPETYEGEYVAYLKSLAQEHIFTKKKKGMEVASGAKSDIDAVDIAIKFEQDSIHFYQEMKKVVVSSSQETVDELIKQEQGHLIKLTELKNLIK